MEKMIQQNHIPMQQPANHRGFTKSLNEPVLLTLIASRPIAEVISRTGIAARDLAKLRDRFEV